MKTFAFHWNHNKTVTLRGDDPVDALNRAGYGPGTLSALDYYDEVHQDAAPMAYSPGATVSWSDPHDPYTKTGVVVRPARRKAWTPNDFVATAPDEGMVMVLWEGDTDPSWEYSAELAASIHQSDR